MILSMSDDNNNDLNFNSSKICSDCNDNNNGETFRANKDGIKMLIEVHSLSIKATDNCIKFDELI